MNDTEYYKCISNEYIIFSKGNIYTKFSIGEYLINNPNDWQRVYISNKPIINNDGYPKFELVSDYSNRKDNSYVPRLVLYANDKVAVAITDYVNPKDKAIALRSFDEITVWKKHKPIDVIATIERKINKLKKHINNNNMDVDKLLNILDEIKLDLTQ